MKNSHRRVNVLVDLIQENNLKIIVEVGVDKGAVLKKVLTDCGGIIEQYWAVDTWEIWDFTEKFQKRSEKDWLRIYQSICEQMLYFPQLRLLKMTSENASELFSDNSIDLIFIDADHQYQSVQDDISFWFPKIKTGGFLTGHDYGHKNFPGVKQAVDEAFGTDISVRGDRVWIKQL